MDIRNYLEDRIRLLRNYSIAQTFQSFCSVPAFCRNSRRFVVILRLPHESGPPGPRERFFAVYIGPTDGKSHQTLHPIGIELPADLLAEIAFVAIDNTILVHKFSRRRPELYRVRKLIRAHFSVRAH